MGLGRGIDVLINTVRTIMSKCVSKSKNVRSYYCDLLAKMYGYDTLANVFVAT